MGGKGGDPRKSTGLRITWPRKRTDKPPHIARLQLTSAGVKWTGSVPHSLKKTKKTWTFLADITTFASAGPVNRTLTWILMEYKGRRNRQENVNKTHRFQVYTADAAP